MKRWSVIFKTLGNVNRLKIIKLLSTKKSMTVGEVARELGISLKSTSKHLIILTNLDIVDYTGKEGHVFYSLNRNLPKDFGAAIDLIV